MNRYFALAITVALTILFPGHVFAQATSGEIHPFQSVLEQLYAEMIPLCQQLIGVGRGLAGFAALWYIASRVWKHLANAEPIDFYPLLRPFALGLCILLFPFVIAVVNGVLKPLVSGTSAMVQNSNNAIAYLLEKKEAELQKTPAWQMYGGEGNYDKWYQYMHPDGEEEGFLDGIGNSVQFWMAKNAYNFRNAIKQWLSEILHVLFEAAALCIDTIRTFYLIILTVIGPIVLGLSVFDGFRHTLNIWLARYINVFLWLPIANIFGSILGKIQENMIKIDINQIERYGDTLFSSADLAYLIFMIIAIIGYFTVPSVANYVVHAGGVNTLLHKTTTSLVNRPYNMAANANTLPASMGSGGHEVGYASGNTSSGLSSENKFMHDKLSGK